MKTSPLRSSIAALVALFGISNSALAHPGHSATDWFSYLPHAGHEGEYATLLAVLILSAGALGVCWLATRKR